jgi:hypothetical protein
MELLEFKLQYFSTHQSHANLQRCPHDKSEEDPFLGNGHRRNLDSPPRGPQAQTSKRRRRRKNKQRTPTPSNQGSERQRISTPPPQSLPNSAPRADFPVNPLVHRQPVNSQHRLALLQLPPPMPVMRYWTNPCVRL